MVEQPAQVALELRDWIASVRSAGSDMSEDILAGYTRLMESEGSTVDDVLAFITYAMLFVDAAEPEGFPLMHKTRILLLRALEALRSHTDTNPFDFIDFDQQSEINQDQSSCQS